MPGSLATETSCRRRRNRVKPSRPFQSIGRIATNRVAIAAAASIAFWIGGLASNARAQAACPAPSAAPISTRSQTAQGAVRITLDDAIQLALKHNHNLLAAQTTIQQDESLETQANLRP